MPEYITEDEVLDALPEADSFLTEYVVYAMARTDAHPLFHLASGVSLLSQAAPIDLSVPLFGSNLYANTYCLIVGPSTVGRKTTAVRIANQGVMISAIEKKGSNGQPRTRDFIAPTPGSAEALIDSFSDTPQQILVYEEFGAFLQASQGDGATNSFAKIRTALTEIYDGTSVGRSTLKSGRKKNVRNPRLSILAAVATDYLEAYTTTPDWTGGFLARFLTFHVEDSYYKDRVVASRSLAPNDEPMREYLVEKFLYMRNRMGVFTPCSGLDEGALMAWELWSEFRNSEAQGANEIVQAGFHRADAFTLKIALLLAMDFGRPYEGKPWKLTERELTPAIAIAMLHLRGLKALGKRIVFASKDMQDRRKVLTRLSMAGENGLTIGDLTEQANLLVGTRVDSILKTLAEQKYIEARMVGGDYKWFRTTKEEI